MRHLGEGVLFSVHGDICFWGQSATSKRVNDVGALSGVCWPKLPGLVGTIVLETTSACLYLNCSLYKHTGIKIKYHNVQTLLIEHLSKHWVTLWYYVTPITYHYVTWDWKQSLRRLCLSRRRDLTKHTMTSVPKSSLSVSLYYDSPFLLGFLRRPSHDYVLIHGPKRFIRGDREEFTSTKSLFV